MAAVPSSDLKRRKTVASQAAHGAADMTRRMVCGGLAGMIAKVSDMQRNDLSCYITPLPMKRQVFRSLHNKIGWCTDPLLYLFWKMITFQGFNSAALYTSHLSRVHL